MLIMYHSTNLVPEMSILLSQWSITKKEKKKYASQYPLKEM